MVFRGAFMRLNISRNESIWLSKEREKATGCIGTNEEAQLPTLKYDVIRES